MHYMPMNEWLNVSMCGKWFDYVNGQTNRQARETPTHIWITTYEHGQWTNGHTDAHITQVAKTLWICYWSQMSGI